MKKKMKVITATTIRRLIDVANSYSVQKDDIVDIKKVSEGEYILIYYTNEED